LTVNRSTEAAAAALAKLTEFVQALGAVPRVLGVPAHDRLLAFLSHLPQFTASALMQVVGDAVADEGLALAGRGLADTTRLASSPPDIWRDIAATNADQIGPALDALIAVLQDLRRDLPDGDRLSDVFTDAAAARDAEALKRCVASPPLPCRHGRALRARRIRGSV
jgi:prephenate dehydrogenase